MKPLLISLTFFLLSFIIFSTCSDENNSVAPTSEKNENISLEKKKNKWPAVIYDSTYGEIVMDYSVITPMAGPCGYKTTYGWATHHFEPKPGKLVGVWPYEFTLANLTTLRTKWGYSHLFFGYDYDNSKWNTAISAGYTLDKIMIAITGIQDAQRASFISYRGNAYAYYVGEPADQNHSMGGVRSALNQFGYTSLFVIDGYKRTYALDYAVQTSDKVLFSSYQHWYEILPGVWVSWPENYDQRSDWSDMRSRYGNKFSMSWINTSEISEFYNLFGHASNLRLNGIWIYGFLQDNGQPTPHYNDQWENISNAAWYSGFLLKFVQDLKITWKCTLQDPCDCDPSDPDAGWYIYNIQPTGSIREI